MPTLFNPNGNPQGTESSTPFHTARKWGAPSSLYQVILPSYWPVYPHDSTEGQHCLSLSTESLETTVFLHAMSNFSPCSLPNPRVMLTCFFSLPMRGCLHHSQKMGDSVFSLLVVASISLCIFSQEMHAFSFFLFGSAKRQNLAARPSQCGRHCHFRYWKLILQPPPEALSRDMVTSLLNYSDRVKNRVQGFPCQESCQPAHFWQPFLPPFVGTRQSPFIFILKVFCLSFLEPWNHQKCPRGAFKNDSASWLKIMSNLIFYALLSLQAHC